MLGPVLAMLAAFLVSVPALDPCEADFDGSGVVDAPDFAVLAQNFGACGRVWGDFDGDGCVTVFDVSAFMSVWGESCD